MGRYKYDSGNQNRLGFIPSEFAVYPLKGICSPAARNAMTGGDIFIIIDPCGK